MPAGRPPYQPAPKDFAMVKSMCGFGIPDYEIARVLGITPPTLRKYFAAELDTGHIEANAKVAQSLYKKATGDGPGATVAAIFWLKCRAGWREAMSPEPLGKKEQAQILAHSAQQGTKWDELLQ